MKRLILIIIGLCLCTALYADMNTYIIGSGSAGGGSCFTDNFTGDNDTALETYNSNYKSLTAEETVEELEIYGNACRPEGAYVDAGCYYDDGTGAKTGTTYTTATVDDGGSIYLPFVSTRSGTDQLGYSTRLWNASEGNWTRLSIYKNGVELGGYTSCTITQSTSHTIYLKAEDSGANVVVSVWIDDSSGDADATETDTSDVISSGYSGFYYPAASNVVWTVDDFSDCEF